MVHSYCKATSKVKWLAQVVLWRGWTRVNSKLKFVFHLVWSVLASVLLRLLWHWIPVGHCRPTAIRIITSNKFVQFVNGILSIVHFSVYNWLFLSLVHLYVACSVL
jgi:hypothetical protein